VLIGVLLVGVGSCVALVLLSTRGPGVESESAARDSVQDSRETQPVRNIPTKPTSRRAHAAEADSRWTPVKREVADSAPPPVTSPRPEPTAHSRQLVSALSRLDRANVPLTPEEAQQWKQSLEQLVLQGAAGVPAVLEFLEKNTDVNFGRAGKDLLGYDSARAAMFDALVQVGGAEGLSGTLQILQNTADPREIALLAQNLEKLAPEQHRHEAIAAVREALAMASSGQLQGADVAPLFEVLTKYGGPEVLAELEQASGQWKYYSALALAQLPEGAGVSTLIEMAQNKAGKGTSDIALQMLSQLSGQYPEARAALLEQARANKISSRTWPYLISALAGNEYHFQNSAFDTSAGAYSGDLSSAHIHSGNQNYFNALFPGNLTAEQINQRLALVDELRSLTADPAAVDALQRARNLLLKRMPQTARTP
jgi:hypothetical protein